MKVLLLLASVALAAAAPQYVSSGIPEAPRPVYGQPIADNSFQQQQQQQGGKVHRHVYVHVAPQEEEDRQSKVIRVPGQADKHVNIIFVKAPSTSFGSNTEIELPPQNEHKTLVYVLLKKPESASDLKIRGPPPTRPTKPEVFFIRYKDQQQGGTPGANPGGYPSATAPGYAPASISKPSGNYGVPY